MTSITVVIPVYNRPQQLEAALASVLAQQPTPDEVIIVDDASPQGLPKLPEHPAVRLVRREHNGGVAAAQNTGLHAASSELICFLHSDDAMLPGKLDRESAMLETAAPGVGAVESGSLRVLADHTVELGPRLEGASAEALLRREVTNVHISPFMFRREALLAIGGFDERLRAYEDFDLLLRFRQRFDIVTIAEPSVQLTQHGEDRLAKSPWMQHGRELLLDKYREELRRFKRLPPGWQQWEMLAALDAFHRGERRRGRRHILRSVRGDHQALVRRAPLVVGSFLPDHLCRSLAERYRVRSGERTRRRARRSSS
ncbi:MAG: glycosyltransferase [Acidimicrobiales bacterium]|nr:glycosyltransferase [Acidimicrobiales bacterium]